ncbi:metal-dependent hydrolase [Paenalkalicoccus suaedae]|uniref:Metal-dependent hydrolase n=1 Tax=Paenalkalicoccus suaedae TaxID=2592382 RepID=A0A859FBG4_9BACI|nr:metal-dependent hydrolase [Paenalkalicoccus suaedae]QKS70132.1 metal-dependent hydrolase [Paenalkalicoccus suaedae]
MRYYTHLTFAYASTMALTEVGTSPVDLTVTSAAIGLGIGALAPDIDETRSWLGRRLPILSTIVKALFGHRGLTHSGLIVGLATFGIVTSPSPFLVAFCLGVILHIVGDLFSHGGIPLFYPFVRKRTTIPLYRTGSLVEILIFMATAAYILWCLVG